MPRQVLSGLPHDGQLTTNPFRVRSWRLMAELQQRIRTPLAAGEDAGGMEGFRDLLDAVTILRIYATASGGVTEVMTTVNMAAGLGRSVIPHVYAPLHSQLAGSAPNLPLVEIIPSDVGTDPIDRLLA